MSLKWFAQNNAGTIVDITDRVRRYSHLDMAESAEEGAVGSWELEVDDPAGDFNIRGYRLVYCQEDLAVGDAYHGIVGVWFTGDRWVGRRSQAAGTDAPTGAGRTWRLQLHDVNTVLGWRINVGNDCNRPAETDLQRIAWIMSTSEFDDQVGPSTTYVDSTDGVNMDAVDYRGQTVRDVIDDCAQDSGRNYGVLWVYSGDPGDPIELKLWYKHGTSSDYSSSFRINNLLSEVEAAPATTYYPNKEAELNRSPSRVAYGVYQVYDGGSEYRTLPITATRFTKIDVTGRGENIKTAAQARQRADRYLRTIKTEMDRITVAIQVQVPHVNAVMPFHRIQVKFTHLPGYSADYVWMRVAERTVRDIAPDVYELALTLMVPAQDDFGDDGGGGPGGGGGNYALLTTAAGPFGTLNTVDWGATGDDTLIPALATSGPFDTVPATNDSRHPYGGWQITSNGTINATYVASACGVVAGGPYTVTWQLLLNGTVVAFQEIVTGSGLFFWGSWGPILSVEDLAVSAGDILTANVSCSPSPMPYFRCPWGVNPGVNNNRLEITGGSF